MNWTCCYIFKYSKTIFLLNSSIKYEIAIESCYIALKSQKSELCASQRSVGSPYCVRVLLRFFLGTITSGLLCVDLGMGILCSVLEQIL